MKNSPKTRTANRGRGYYRESELLLLPDGRIMAHDITPAMARVLETLAPGSMVGRLQPNNRADNIEKKKVK